MPDLLLNLFEVALPNSDIDLLVRPRPETLIPGEFWFKHVDTQLAASVRSGLTAPGTSLRDFRLSELPPGLVERLILEGLSVALNAKGMIVEQGFTHCVAFDRPEIIPTEFEFIEIRRGIVFEPEHVTIRGKGHFGLFAAMRLRRRFTPSLEDGALRKAAHNELVRLEDGNFSKPVKLLEVSGSTCSGSCQ